ncbi:MAG TPA: DUF1318 domain-containing protein [Methylococcaceae bacterium]|jgi:uncharacterized protein YdbL (DUF1318 family)|nr:DUF1318 domain-containing protein [Methylococcaceae bacterium]
MKIFSIMGALILTACVTINIYFPAAAAEHVADEIIQGIQAEEAILEQQESLPPQSKIDTPSLAIEPWVEHVLNWLIPPAQAAADLSVNTPEIRQLRAAMRQRFSVLKPFYAQGLIGTRSDGLLTGRDPIPLKDRNKVNQLIAAENANRQQLYQAIANANGHPEWFNNIKLTFAKRWISNAKSGWWYQTSNGWKQK